MKKLLSAFFIIFISFPSYSQLLSWTPDFITDTNTPVTITVDVTKGNSGLLNYGSTSDVYVHTGVITNLSSTPTDWKYVKFNQNFNMPNAALQATYIGNNKYQFTITGGIRAYYGVPGGETILKITFLLRNGNGSKVQRNANGTDMYIPVYNSNLAVRFKEPLIQPTYTADAESIEKNIGENISVNGVSNNTATLKIYLNGSVVQTTSGATSITATPTITTAGNQTLVLEANDGSTTVKDTIIFFVPPQPPAGLNEGVNYDPNNTSVTLLLYAPYKTSVTVIGEFPGSNWTAQPQYQMTNTADGFYWYVTITGLTPGTEYAYQYLVDGTLKIADPYTEKVLDPYADGSIPSSTYPSLKAYPTGLTTGIVSVLQTAAPAYNWAVTNFSRPDKRKLLIYELLVRDFVAKHDWQTLRDTINYFKHLGINTIEIMPFNEFENNNSWGYNPDFYFAPDKYYGPANTLKEFIDTCHANGIAVVMDIALNHSFGLSPMVQLYWDNINNRPAANNPWFNPVAKHPYNVGYDMNHESLATKSFVSRVVDHWLTNYKIDGFRFDLSKGFTQTQTCDNSGGNCNEGSFSAYDASRVAIWKRYYDTVQSKSSGAYAILEHFADNTEEKELSDYGMMLWGNANNNYNQAAMGYSTDWDFSYGIYTHRGWTQPGLVTYMESHDEERQMYKKRNFGNANESYNIKILDTALARQELTAAFFFTIPGPKMIWQFGEVGYDSSINTCQNGTVNSNCRTDMKPIKWDYLQQSDRKHVYDVYSALMRLRANPSYTDLFVTNQITDSLGGGFKWIKVTDGISSLLVIGNFDVVQQTASVTFPAAGTWYDYLNQTTIGATGTPQSFTLQPGEYHVYLNRSVALPVSLLNFSGKNIGTSNVLTWLINNEQNISKYELQRSINGRDYISISNFSPTGLGKYTFTDKVENITAPAFFYRLKSIDKDGKITYSAVVKLNAIAKNIFVEIAPNPFMAILSVNIQSATNGSGSLVITDISGRRLLHQNIVLSKGINAFEIKETARLMNGTYLLIVEAPGKMQTIKVIKTN